jgi:uncharacterized ion transporter superfamily protein YfcC
MLFITIACVMFAMFFAYKIDKGVQQSLAREQRVAAAESAAAAAAAAATDDDWLDW